MSPRRCAVRIGDEKCLSTRVAWRFRVAGVGNRGHVGVALDRRFIVEDVCATSMVDVHFAWQAWDSGCIMSALEKELGGGSAWELRGIVHFDVTQRAFRVALTLTVEVGR